MNIINDIMNKLENETNTVSRNLVNKIMELHLCGPDGNSFSRIMSIREYNEQLSNGVYTAQVEYQRQYCYTDVKGGNGHPWQRSLMGSLITFQSLDYIWVNDINGESHIIDGGQRSRTIRGWFTNCIRLPKGLVYKFKGKNLELGGKNWSEVKDYYPEFSEHWLENYQIDFKVFMNYTNEECSVIFTKLNTVNSMSKPEYRNSIWSDMATSIRELSDFENKENKTLDIFHGKQIEETEPGKFRGIRHGIKFGKRGFDDFVSKISYLTINPLKVTGNKVLEEWYRNEREGTGSFKKFKKKIKQNLKWINDLILNEKDNQTRSSLLGLPEIQFLFNVKTHLERTYEFRTTNGLQLIEFWRNTITLLKTKDWFVDYNGDKTPFKTCLSSLSSGRDTEIEDWTSIVSDHFVEKYNNWKKDSTEIEVGFKLLDKSRSIKKSVKEQVLVEQDFKCKYYDWCGNRVTMSSPGDHSKTSHTDGGSSSDVDNCDMTCETCNGEKGSLSSEDFEYVIENRIKKRDGK